MSRTAPYPERQLAVSALGCTRGGQTVLKDITFAARPGEAVLLRGPNGAGKSTLLMCLAGLLPFAGAIAWSGRGPEDRAGTDLHFISHLTALKPHLSVSENLKFWAQLNGGDERNVPAALAAARLDHAARLEAGILSAGQTRRLSLCRLLVAPRPIWLLDEPTSALDAQGEHWLLGLVDGHLQRGGLAIIATHLDLALKTPVNTLQIGTRT